MKIKRRIEETELKSPFGGWGPKGRGSQINPHNKFLKHSLNAEDEFKEYQRLENEQNSNTTKL